MTKRVALYARVSTDRAQTVENQLRDLQSVAARLGWTVVSIFSDEGVSGARGREKRPGFDALLKGVARREFDMIATWSVCRLGRSLPDLVSFLGDIQAKGVDLYLHVQGLDTSTPSGRMLFQMLGVFAEFERAMIRERVMAGLNRVRGSKRLGRPPLAPERIAAIRALLDEGVGIRETARRLGASTTSVMRVAQGATTRHEEAA
jgi:DNA invertase Pin-like site-specific DNA recombinase